ncbi:ATP-binding cassette domain-containing protein [Candidatus Enterococcus ikei]|uniref:ATP-binding cassette domain-containing protein n=1 Tax=Candidatus Enterococcus ikei TaxID=2815326 RepID=A0ABS3GYL1_9ENTE|nr:ATP-binding cassette domain-containing protein [Enterococcus sp. DIV0869a]MBO0440353.1 ATP-binding cassette domain-containing protein [Enterococcus sp. DIV0869a]
MILSSSISLFQTYSSLGVIKVSLERISDIFDEYSENILSTQENTLKSSFEEISFSNVSFKYSVNSKNVLQNINLNILRGETISFVGSTGCGKSTLVKLLVGLYEPTDGYIQVDGFRIEDIKHLISIVPQENMLSNKTIKENLLVGTTDIDDQAIISACKRAEIYDEIMKMPLQFNSIISEIGDNISGGQKQRISIARSLLHNPKILILDEATSSLDNITEAKIENNLKGMNCTIIKIAHRLETVINSNCIYYLESGKIVEQGSHNELISKKGRYYNLYRNKTERRT